MRLRVASVALVLLAAGCSEEESESFGEGLGSLLLFFLLLALLLIVIVVVLLVLGVSFLGTGVARMTRRSPPPPAGPWWDAAAEVWRAPDGSVFDAALQQWVPPPPGTPPPPPPGGAVTDADRTSGAVLIGIGGAVITFVAAAVLDGVAEPLVVVGGIGLTALLIRQLWDRGT